MSEKKSLAFQITNWCDLRCAHCLNNSGRMHQANFMPIKKIEQYLDEYQVLPGDKYDYVMITGGEGLSPYLFNKPDYIPKVLHSIIERGFVPDIKTNGFWGRTADYRKPILYSLATVAYDTQKLVTLDISIDEFHKNLVPVANIVSDVINDDYIRPGVRIVLVGFNTPASKIAFASLKDELLKRKIQIVDSVDWLYPDDFEARDKSGAGIRIYADYNAVVWPMGRAKENKLNTVKSCDQGCEELHLVIDGDDNISLEYMYPEKIAGRPLSVVIESLKVKRVSR